VRSVPRKHDAGAAGVGAERVGVAVSGEGVQDDGGGAFYSLQLVGGADEEFGEVGQQGADGGGLGDVHADHGEVMRPAFSGQVI
jgi:hypothetical protein